MSILKTPKRFQNLIARSKIALAQKTTGTNSKRPNRFPHGYPTHIHQGYGCNLISVDGRKYVDFICGLGASILGYAHPKVLEAVEYQAAKGETYSLPSYLEVEVAETISALVRPIDQVRFLKTGNEAALASIRIAMAATGKKRVAVHGYHGWCFVEDDRSANSDWVVFNESNDLLEMDDLAAVIIEPIILDDSLRRKAEVEEIQRIAKAKGAVFIIDEIITGCRRPRFTVTTEWGLEPDIVLLGKAIANGYPLSAVCGKKEVMDAADYFVSSTFSGEAVSLAACKATLGELAKHQNLDDLKHYGRQLSDGLNQMMPRFITGWGARGQIDIHLKNMATFCQLMADAGVLFGRAFFFNFAHIEANVIPSVLNLAQDAALKVKLGKAKLRGPLPLIEGAIASARMDQQTNLQVERPHAGREDSKLSGNDESGS